MTAFHPISVVQRSCCVESGRLWVHDLAEIKTLGKDEA
jgi:hypothetical protein